jgi:hypothetical protein
LNVCRELPALNTRLVKGTRKGPSPDVKGLFKFAGAFC